jgi:hypothetical protein
MSGATRLARGGRWPPPSACRCVGSGIRRHRFRPPRHCKSGRARAFAELLVVVTPTQQFVPHVCSGAAGNRTKRIKRRELRKQWNRRRETTPNNAKRPADTRKVLMASTPSGIAADQSVRPDVAGRPLRRRRCRRGDGRGTARSSRASSPTSWKPSATPAIRTYSA